LIEQRYITATAATSLHEDANSITQLDVIKASGMSSRNLAAHYLRLISKPTKEDMVRVYAALLYVVESRKLASGTEFIAVALDWLLDTLCKTCKGAGVVAKGESEHKCPRCKGARYRKEPSNRDAQLLIDYVKSCRDMHAGRMLRALK